MNTPTLMQSEMEELKEVTKEPRKTKVDVTVSITLSKSTTVTVNLGEENDEKKLMDAFNFQKYSPEQACAFLKEYNQRKSINNIQTKIKDLSGWTVDDKAIIKE